MVTLSPGRVLRRLRSILYVGVVQTVVRRSGINHYLSDPYWNLVHRLSPDTQEHTIEGFSVEFNVNTLTEFMRFRQLAGEQHIIADVLRSLTAKDTFYDVGANVGTYTCFAASKLGDGRTVAFEPEPENVASLRKNIELNDLHVDVCPFALSDTDGTTRLALTGEEAGEGEHSLAVDDTQDTVEIETKRGDTALASYDLPTPTVVKIDVEGAELLVLKGMASTLREHVRLVYLEVHPEKLVKFGSTTSEVRTFLEDAGFEVTELLDRGGESFWRASKF